jgi:hypothetical protein
MFHKFQNGRQARTGRNMVKSSNPNAPSTDSSSFAPVHTLPRRIFRHSASSFLAVRISFCDIAAFLFRKPLFIN